jgi:ATP:cob(I)alamin adenosyltransferase
MTESRIYTKLVAERPLRPVFVVPGANPVSAALDLARTIVRRAERRLVSALDQTGGSVSVSRDVRAYLNRVSDLLFVLARRAAATTKPSATARAPNVDRRGTAGTGAPGIPLGQRVLQLSPRRA